MNNHILYYYNYKFTMNCNKGSDLWSIKFWV